MSTIPTPVIDCHLNIQPWKSLNRSALEHLTKGRTDLGQIETYLKAPESLLKYMDLIGLQKACIMNYISPELMGFDEQVNYFVYKYCEASRQKLLAVGSIHPRYTKDAEWEMDQLLLKLNLSAITIHPSHQYVRANAYIEEGLASLALIYEKLQQHQKPVFIFSGADIISGARVKYANPLDIDDVAIDFPKLKIIIVQAGYPFWVKEAAYLASVHPNVYLSVAGIPVDKLTSSIPQMDQLSVKILFGSGWPSPFVDSIPNQLNRFWNLPLKTESKRKILFGNSLKIFA